MSVLNGTGITYPEIELGGKKYTVKFTRGMIYRMGKAGVSFSPRLTGSPDAQLITMEFSQLIDVLHLAIDFPGTHEELAELAYDKRGELVTALVTAWSKIMLPTLPIPDPAANPETDQLQ